MRTFGYGPEYGPVPQVLLTSKVGPNKGMHAYRKAFNKVIEERQFLSKYDDLSGMGSIHTCENGKSPYPSTAECGIVRCVKTIFNRRKTCNV